MSKPTIIWGSSGHAKVIHEFLPSLGFELVALFDSYAPMPITPSIPCFLGMSGFNEWLSRQEEHEQFDGFVAIGGSLGKERAAIQKQLKSFGIRFPAIIHPSAFVATNALIGEGTQILANASVCAEAIIGSSCIINTKASVDHECILGNGVHVGPGATLTGCVAVGNNAFIAASATILPRIKIGKNSIVGAGALVTKDVMEGTIVIGQPARFYRSI